MLTEFFNRFGKLADLITTKYCTIRFALDSNVFEIKLKALQLNSRVKLELMDNGHLAKRQLDVIVY